MSYDIDKFVLWENDGTEALAVSATSAHHHFMILNKENPGSTIATTASTTMTYSPAGLSTIDVSKYDYFGLHAVSQPVAGTATTAFTGSAFHLTGYPVWVGPQTRGPNGPVETDATFLEPAPPTAGAGVAYQTYQNLSGWVSSGGTGAAVVLNTAALWPKFGFSTTAATSLSADDILNLHAWIGSTHGTLQVNAPIPNNVIGIDELKLCATWKVSYGTPMLVPVRIRMKIYGIGLRAKRQW